MDTQVPDGPNARFTIRDVADSAFLDDHVADIAANAADIAMLVDQRGVVRDAAFPGEDLNAADYEHWLGRKWIDLVNVDSKPKVEALLTSQGHVGSRRWRHINHLQSDQADLPVRFFTIPAGKPGWTLAIGRDLRALSRMQERLINAQRTMERDYSEAREAETRFRLLFQLSSEGVLIVDGDTLNITDINPTAAGLLGYTAQRLERRSIDAAFGAINSGNIRDTLAVARKSGRTEEASVSLAASGIECLVRATVFRQERKTHFLVRLMKVDQSTEKKAGHSLAELAEHLPDGLVLANIAGSILSVNEAFVDLAQLPSADAAVGATFDTYFGRTETEINVLMANLREHGLIRNFSSVVRTQHGLLEPVEVSAVSAPGTAGTVFGFSIRLAGRRQVAGSRNEGATLPSSVDKLSDLVGRVSLKEIVRESTDMIERSCIEAALELTNDNRASAAEMLGLSRQSLYAKMHRHNIGELSGKTFK